MVDRRKLQTFLCYPSIAICLASCSPGFDITPSGYARNIRLAFQEKGWLASADDDSKCVSELTVAQERWPTRAQGGIVWQIKAIRGCVPITGVDIGHVPYGFRETVRHLPLGAGKMYGVTALADPFTGASLPWFVCRGYPAIIDWKNESRLADPPRDCIR